MIAGDTRQRNFSWPVPDPPKSEWSGSEVSQPALAQKALGFNCLNYAIAPEGSLYRHFLPDKAYLDGHCTDGIRMEIMFPSCWNGKDLDSPDHKSHVAYPTLVNGGTCPKGYETKLVSLFYETIWNTYAFKGRDGQFAIANGDPTGKSPWTLFDRLVELTDREGFGYHGDFMAAWDGDTLERAVKQCTNPSGKVEDCPIFDLQSQSEAQTCKISMPTELKDENYQGPREGLPGKVGIQAGPAYALKKSSGDSSNQSGGASSQSSSVASSSVPTLSYSSAAPASSIGGSYGGAVGGLFAEVVSTSSSTTSSSPSPPSSAPPPSTTPSSSSTSPAAVAPTTTSPPSLQAAGQLSTISTTYLTKGQLAYEIVVVEEDVTVTATSTVAAGKHRRHLHRHQHHHGRK